MHATMAKTISPSKCFQQQYAHSGRGQLMKGTNILLKLWTIITMASRMVIARPSASSSSSAAFHPSSPDSPQNNINELLEWLMFRNASHYSPIAPASPESLSRLNNSDQWASNGLGLTAEKAPQLGEPSTGRRMRKHHRHRVDSNTPFTQRAICPFQFVLNHRPNRVPSTLIEVKCLSPNPSQRLLGRPLPLVECEPMRWTVRVLECAPDSPGEQCQPVEERIPLACVPVLQANREMGEEEAAGGEKAVPIIAVVPAEPMDENLVPT